jgi:hypothetical protein
MILGAIIKIRKNPIAGNIGIIAKVRPFYRRLNMMTKDSYNVTGFPAIFMGKKTGSSLYP